MGKAHKLASRASKGEKMARCLDCSCAMRTSNRGVYCSLCRDKRAADLLRRMSKTYNEDEQIGFARDLNGLLEAIKSMNAATAIEPLKPYSNKQLEFIDIVSRDHVPPSHVDSMIRARGFSRLEDMPRRDVRLMIEDYRMVGARDA